MGGEGGDVFRGWLMGGLGGVPPSGGAAGRRQAQNSAFAPGSSTVAVGFFGLCVSFVQKLPPNTHPPS